MKPKTQIVKEETAIEVIEPQDLAKPEQDTKFAHAAALKLMDIVEQNGWAISLGGKSKHLTYEAWQTVGKYFGYTVKTFDAQPVEIGGITGFKAYAKVINEKTGIEVGGAEAYCMKDEYNWKAKPTFQLASMAQTRAGSKALRQILGYVAALAHYNPTPYEEMTPTTSPLPSVAPTQTTLEPAGITVEQKGEIMSLMSKKGLSFDDLNKPLAFLKVKKIADLSSFQAQGLIKKMERMNDKGAEELDMDEIEEGITKQQLEK